MQIRKAVHELAPLLRDALQQWRVSRLPLQAAGLAFYLALSLGPLLIILTELVGVVVGARSAETDILNPLKPFIGGHAVGALRGLAATFMHRSSALPSGVSLVLLFVGAAGIFEQLKETLDSIWQVPMRPSGILSIVRNKTLSVVIVAGAILLILILLTATTLIAEANKDLATSAPLVAHSLNLVNLLVSLGVVTLLFGVTFKVLPDTPVRWKDVWLGATCTALLFIIGQFLIGFFMARSGMETTYGRATAMLLILVWLYYSAQIYLFGAVLTRVYATRHKGIQ